jgi:hypothetical protein
MLHYVASFKLDLGVTQEAIEILMTFLADIEFERNKKLFNKENCIFDKENPGMIQPTIKLSVDELYHFNIFPNFLLKKKLSMKEKKKDIKETTDKEILK